VRSRCSRPCTPCVSAKPISRASFFESLGLACHVRRAASSPVRATDQTARVWRMPKSSDICGFDQPGKQFDALSVLRPAAILTGHGARITNALFSPDDRTIITASQDGWVRGWVLGADAETTAIVLPQPERSSASGRLRLRPQTGENLRLSQRPFSLVRLG
jgi:WD40 repeat protein